MAQSYQSGLSEPQETAIARAVVERISRLHKNRGRYLKYVGQLDAMPSRMSDELFSGLLNTVRGRADCSEWLPVRALAPARRRRADGLLDHAESEHGRPSRGRCDAAADPALFGRLGIWLTHGRESVAVPSDTAARPGRVDSHVFT